MTITRLKAKNQLTIPVEIIKRLHLRPHEFFLVNVEGNYIKLTPVDVEPRYTEEDISVMDTIVEKEKGKAKVVNAGKEFSSYIKKIAK